MWNDWVREQEYLQLYYEMKTLPKWWCNQFMPPSVTHMSSNSSTPILRIEIDKCMLIWLYKLCDITDLVCISPTTNIIQHPLMLFACLCSCRLVHVFPSAFYFVVCTFI